MVSVAAKPRDVGEHREISAPFAEPAQRMPEAHLAAENSSPPGVEARGEVPTRIPRTEADGRQIFRSRPPRRLPEKVADFLVEYAGAKEPASVAVVFHRHIVVARGPGTEIRVANYQRAANRRWIRQLFLPQIGLLDHRSRHEIDEVGPAVGPGVRDPDQEIGAHLVGEVEAGIPSVVMRVAA